MALQDLKKANWYLNKLINEVEIWDKLNRQ